MGCPNGCGKLSKASNSRVEFYDGDNEIELRVFIEWCPDCLYIHYISAD